MGKIMPFTITWMDLINITLSKRWQRKPRIKSIYILYADQNRKKVNQWCWGQSGYWGGNQRLGKSIVSKVLIFLTWIKDRSVSHEQCGPTLWFVCLFISTALWYKKQPIKHAVVRTEGVDAMMNWQEQQLQQGYKEELFWIGFF